MTDTGREEFVQYQSDALVLKLARFVWGIHAISAIMLASLLFAYAPLLLLLPWTALMIGASALQGFASFYGAYLFHQERPLHRWALVFDVTAVLIALGWMWFALFLVPSGESNLSNFIGFIMGGAVLTLTGTQNLHYRVMAVSISLIVVSRIYRLIADAEGSYAVYSSLMLFVFLGLMFGLGLMLKRFTQNGFTLQWEKSRLAEDLQIQTEELKAARAEADAANEAKSMFLAQASHDLRQPLHAMGLQMASLSKETMTPKTRTVMERIDQSVEVLSKLFNSLLDVTLLDTRQLIPKPVAFDVGALIQDIADEFIIAAKAENMEVTANAAEVWVKSDPLLVRRILQNLVSNAIRHSEGGEVALKTIQENQQIQLVIKDTGKGIPHEQKQHMFDAFTKGEVSKTGLGLGLAIVRRLVDVLDISIDVTSDKEKGTEFSFGPFTCAHPVELQQVDAAQNSEHEAGRVLVVDDDRPTLEATAALLSAWGWEIEARERMDDLALDALEPLDLIIVDYDLGFGQTGLQIVKALRKKYGPVPALVITGSTTADTRQHILKQDCLLLHKPVRPVQLRSAIISVMG